MKRVSLMILVVLLVATLPLLQALKRLSRAISWDPIFADMERA